MVVQEQLSVTRNANTCNANGIELANEVCALAAKELGLKEDDIIVASTGVIGQPMSIDPFKNHMKELVKRVKCRWVS